MTDSKAHWDNIYATNDPLAVSWYQSAPTASLELIANTGIDKDARIIDVGGGASTLVDSLLDKGFKNITVLDISEKAMELTRQRLSSNAKVVDWIVSDVTEFEPSRKYEIWHDRSVLHFLTNYQDRMKYVEVLKKALNPEASAIIGAFAVGGPNKCSGLPVVQYDADKMQLLLGETFHLQEQRQEVHITPAGKQQLFAFFRFQRQS